MSYEIIDKDKVKEYIRINGGDMMKKRIIAAAVCILMLSAFTACAQKPAQNKPSVTETENGSILAGSDETAAPETTEAESESTEAAPKTTESAERHTEAQTSRPAPTTEKRAQTTVKKPEKTTKTETTKAFEYDMSNPAVKAVMSMVGEKHRCTEVAEAAVEQAGLSGWRTFEKDGWTYRILEPEGFIDLGTKVTKAQIRPGDILYYADGGRGESHVAVYVGNGQAVHGNWTTDGTTKLARAFYREPTYVIHIDYGK